MTVGVPPPPQLPVTVYWRPGCGFCAVLLRRLESSALQYVALNIWDDPDAAAFVRSVANGNETVPTVVVGDRAMVNPPFHAVIDAAAG
jgi:glutaredoxin-like protein